MSRKPPHSDHDEPDLWDRVVADVTPLKGRTRPKKAAAASPAPATATARTGRSIGGPVVAPPAPAARRQPQARDLDRRTQQKLDRGQMDIEAVLDLHGHGQGEARERLLAFLTGAHRQGMRCVLVITGKGRDGAGILRARLPEWVEDAPLKPIVLRVTPARQAHGGAGAFYVLLRRQRG